MQDKKLNDGSHAEYQMDVWARRVTDGDLIDGLIMKVERKEELLILCIQILIHTKKTKR